MSTFATRFFTPNTLHASSHAALIRRSRVALGGEVYTRCHIQVRRRDYVFARLQPMLLCRRGVEAEHELAERIKERLG